MLCFLGQSGNEAADLVCTLGQRVAVVFFFGSQVVNFALQVFFEFADLNQQGFTKFVNGSVVLVFLLLLLEFESVDFFVETAVFWTSW